MTLPDPDLLVHLLVPDGDGRRVLVVADGGRTGLPSLRVALEGGDRVVTAVQRALRASWSLDAPILETYLPPPDDDPADAGEEALVVLETPPASWSVPSALSWAHGPTELPENIAERARAWLTEWAGLAPPPPLRPRWARAGWMARAADWIRASLADRGLHPDAPPDVRRLWAISALVRVSLEGGGGAWFKAVFPHFHHEPAVTALLERSVPALVPEVIATDDEEGWLLMGEAGAPLSGDEDGAEDDVVLAAIGQLVDAQAATRGRLSEFATLGCPHRPLSRLADELVRAMDDAPVLGGRAVAPQRLAEVAGFVRDRAAWLDGIGMDDVLVHGDFHVGNLLVDPRGTRIIDWSDAAISHPVVEIGPWFGEVRPDLRPAGWRAWIEALSRFGPVEDLRLRERDAYAVACAYQVVSYAGILRGIEPANRHQLRDGFVGYWKDLEASVPA